MPAASTVSRRLAPSSASNRPTAEPASSSLKKASAPTTTASRTQRGENDHPDAQVAQLQAQIAALTSERDSLTTAFESLQSLRQTEPEKTLASYKKASEARWRHGQDLVASLKSRLESLERRQRKTKGGDKVDEAVEDDDEMDRLRVEVEELKREKKKAEEKAKRLSLELRTEVESSRALLTNSSSNTSNGSSSSRRETAADAQAVRRLYEDLTGIVISRIDVMQKEEDQSSEASERRKFTGVFAAQGHHDLQLTLEESASSLPSAHSSSSGSSSSASRQDLVFYPHLSSSRDARLLESAAFPSYLREEIRFDRGLSVRFLGTLVKGLKQ